jgi:transposase InsO family protein
VAFFTNIIHRFGVPNSIITDNGTQFTGRKFLDFCEDHHIRVDWAIVAHPMTNGQVERANNMILQGLKPRIYNDLNKFGRRWMKELPSVVWSLRTTPSRATGFTPFFLVYGAEAILPTDLEYGSPRTRAYDDRSNQSSREDSLDQLEEARDVALLHCDATTPEGFGPETSRWATWCFGYDKTPEGATSSHLPGKGRS